MNSKNTIKALVAAMLLSGNLHGVEVTLRSAYDRATNQLVDVVIDSRFLPLSCTINQMINASACAPIQKNILEFPHVPAKLLLLIAQYLSHNIPALYENVEIKDIMLLPLYRDGLQSDQEYWDRSAENERRRQIRRQAVTKKFITQLRKDLAQQFSSSRRFQQNLLAAAPVIYFFDIPELTETISTLTNMQSTQSSYGTRSLRN